MTLESYRNEFMPGVPLEDIIKIAEELKIESNPNVVLSKDDRDKLLSEYRLHEKLMSYVSIFGYNDIKNDYQKLIDDYSVIINSPTCPLSAKKELSKFVSDIESSAKAIDQTIESLSEIVNKGE